MEPDAGGLRAALPETLRERWDRIAAIDARKVITDVRIGFRLQERTFNPLPRRVGLLQALL